MPSAKRTLLTNKKSPSAHRTFWSISFVKPLFVSLVVLLVVAQLAFDMLVFRTATQQGDRNVTVTQLITAAVENSMRPVQVQADSGKQYIAEVRLALPATYDYELTPLRYAYEPAVDGVPAVLRVSSLGTVKRAEAALWLANQPTSVWNSSNAKALFDEVPSLQACSRGVYVFFGPNDAKTYSESLQYEGQTQLKDGRELHVYTEQPNACKQSSFESLIAYIKQAQSY